MAHLVTIIIRHLHHDDEAGQTLVEYGLLLALITLVVVVTLFVLGPIVRDLFQEMGNSLA
jgi:Flp pilus assembly pilin Flp